MLKIGDFSRLSRISVRMLRHYDEIGLLKPAVRVASCILKGDYSRMGEATAAVASWIHDNGYESDGPMFNIYHVGPAQTTDPDEYVTEVCFPVK